MGRIPSRTVSLISARLTSWKPFPVRNSSSRSRRRGIGATLPTATRTSDSFPSTIVALTEAFTALYACPKCGGPCVADASKTVCPYDNCREPFPHLTLKVEGKRQAIPLIDGATVVGRDRLGGSPKVSVRHAVFRRIGPETWIESTGSNGTYRWNGTKWIRLPDRKALLVQAGDRLRLADVAARLD